jgi:hypothetical protein
MIYRISISIKMSEKSEGLSTTGSDWEPNKLILKFITSYKLKKRVDRVETKTFTEDDEPEVNKWVIMPNSYFGQFIRYVADIAFVISFFFVFLIIGSRMNLLDEIRPLEIILDFILFFDMITNFFMAYENDGEYVTKLKTISIRYLSNKFVLDFLGVVPGLVSFELVPELYPLKLFRYIHIPRFFNLVYSNLTLLSKRIKFLDKFTINVIVKISKTLITLILNIHFFVCFWILLSNYSITWENLYNTYVLAFYYMTVTFTTVGYGDIVPDSNFQIWYVIFLELIGLALFSYIRSTILKITLKNSALYLEKRKKEAFEAFLYRVSTVKEDMDIPFEIFSKVAENLEITYNYRISTVFNEYDFLYELKPKLVKQLVFEVLKKYYIQFKEFFWCEQVGFQADDKFIMKMLVGMEWQVFLSQQVILGRGETADCVFLIEEGEVEVMDHLSGDVLAVLSQSNFFGDYQILLDTRSNVCFRASPDSKVICFTLK